MLDVELRVCDLRYCHGWQFQGEGKFTAHAYLAGEPDLATHQLHKPLTDGQAQSSPAIAARSGAFGLRETAEYALLMFWRDANAGVLYSEFDSDSTVGPCALVHGKYNLSFGCEFDSVATQISEDLL